MRAEQRTKLMAKEKPKYSAEEIGIYPIGVLSDRTGVLPSTLRAWERRYGLLQPQRKPKGHRLYSENDVAWVERIRELLDQGYSLSNIAQLKQSGHLDTLKQPHSEAWREYQKNALDAVRTFNSHRLEAVFTEAASLYPMGMVTERLIEPVFHALGESWAIRPGGIAEEHFYSAWVRLRLGARFHHTLSQADGTPILCACLPGAQHDIALLLFSINALAKGYSILYFGPDLPLTQIPHVVANTRVSAVVLSSRTGLGECTDAELADFTARLSVPVFLGGGACHCDLPRFKAKGGVLLGARIGPAVKTLAAKLPS
jgi:DNA-binding transcriptional MerR regulator